MTKAQWLPPRLLQQRTEKLLRGLLNHAAENVPFYRDALSSLDLKAADLRSISDLQRLPIVSKSVFRERPLEHFLAQNIPAHRRLEWTTSGSTGEPFKFFLDRKMMPVVFASHLFYDSWYGLKPFDRYVRIMAPPAPESDLLGNVPVAARLRYAIRSRLQRIYERSTQLRFSMFDVDEDRAEEIYRRIEQFRPKYLLGYTSTLATMANALERRNLRLSAPLAGVITIAETLTEDRKQAISAYFDAPIINRYGQREFKFWCAQSCSESPDRFHVNTELVVWEVIRDDGEPAAPGELGRVVLTNLHNYAMPFIRYDTGDMAVAGTNSCACGRGFPVVEQLQGRSQEVVKTPSGKMINPVSLGQYLFVSHGYVDAVKQYQLVVEKPDRARLLIVPATDFGVHIQDRLRRDMGQLLGTDMTVEVSIVKDIPLEKSGKRPIIKNLTTNA
jgi:phenylacetate-CoA ligase